MSAVDDFIAKVRAARPTDVFAASSYHVSREEDGTFSLTRTGEISLTERLGTFATAHEALQAVLEPIGAVTVDIGGGELLMEHLQKL